MKLLIAEDNILFRGLPQQTLAPDYSLLPDPPKLQLTSSTPWTIPHE
jgi:hypothetical protein